MQYDYDAAGRLSSVTANGVTTTYRYNGDGARVSQTVGEVTTTYTLDANRSLTQVLAESTNGQTMRYLHGLDLIAQSDGTRAEYFAYDGLGSVRQVLSGSGTVLTSQTFDPYGAPYLPDASADNSFGFTGEQVDENGLIYLRARYYNPAQGRFMQVDPSRLESNGYQYAGSSPTMFTDPSGLCVDPYDLYFDAWPMVWGGRPCLGAPNQYNSAAYQALIAPMTTNSGLTGTSVVGATTCALNFEICGPALALVGEGLFWTSNIYAAGVTGQYVAADVFGTEAPSPAELQAVQDIAAGNMIGWQTWLWQQPVGLPHSWQSGSQAQINQARAWTSLNEYYPSSEIGTAAPGAFSQIAAQNSARIAAYQQSSWLLGRSPIPSTFPIYEPPVWQNTFQPTWQNTFQPTSLRQLDIVLRNDPTGLYRKIDRIIKKYPLGNYCERCSKELYTLFTKAGYTAQIGRIDTRARFITLADNTLVSDGYPPFHEFVLVDDIVYDAITGAQGMYISDYLNLYYPGVFTDGTATLTYFSP